MDDEEKIIKISGVVRPMDISSENTVPSEKVSEAMVSYDGEGPLSKNTEKNWLDKVLDFIWPF
jgi:flagellar L-ring protein precursor FlgH